MRTLLRSLSVFLSVLLISFTCSASMVTYAATEDEGLTDEVVKAFQSIVWTDATLAAYSAGANVSLQFDSMYISNIAGVYRFSIAGGSYLDFDGNIYDGLDDYRSEACDTCAIKFGEGYHGRDEIWILCKYSVEGTSSEDITNAINACYVDTDGDGSYDEVATGHEIIADNYDEETADTVDTVANAHDAAVASGWTDENSKFFSYDSSVTINTLDIDPLEGLSEFSWDEGGAGNGITIMQETDASFYRLIFAVATIGMVTSLIFGFLRLGIFGYRVKNEVATSLLLKLVVFICICGFADILALVIPVILTIAGS